MTRRAAAVLALLLAPRLLGAQGIPLASLGGRVTAEGGAPLSGVRITVRSANLQGEREALTMVTGEYFLPFLPPGDYVVRFSLPGMQDVDKGVTLNAAVEARLDVELEPARAQESVTVSADAVAGTPLDTTQVLSSYKQKLVDQLPLDRSLRSVSLACPGCHRQRPDREHRQRQHATGPRDLRSAVLREPVSRGRRCRQREPQGPAPGSLHRGRDSGDDDPEGQHLLRIRPLHRRRRERGHEVGRQPLPRFVSHRVHERRLDGTGPLPGGQRAVACRPAQRELRGDARRAAVEGPYLVLRRRAPAEAGRCPAHGCSRGPAGGGADPLRPYRRREPRRGQADRPTSRLSTTSSPPTCVWTAARPTRSTSPPATSESSTTWSTRTPFVR